MTFAVLMTNITSIEAQTSQITTYVYLSVVPSPVGVGQQVIVTTWIAPYPTSYADDAFHGVTVTITKPDGTSETRGPFNLLVVENSQHWFAYTPTTVGNYTFKASYPGETRPAGQFSSAESPTTTLAVQQEPIQYYQDTPLPTNYWTRPINAQNRLWASIAGDWLMPAYSLTYRSVDGVSYGALNPYSEAPLAPHVMWTNEITSGGLVGGDLGDLGYFSGPSYSSLFSPPIIMNGKIYYSKSPGIACVDLRTGKELWRNTAISGLVCGQVYNAQKYSYTTAGCLSYLWTNSWQRYNAFDGSFSGNFTNYPTSLSRPIFSDDGSMLVHVIGRGWLALWNSSAAGSGTNREWSRGLQWNVTIDNLVVPTSLYATLNITSSPAPRIYSVWGNVLIGRVTRGGPGYNVIYDAGYDVTTGRQLWVNNYTSSLLTLEAPTYWQAVGDGVFAQFIAATRRWNGYDVNTGKLLWVSDPQDYPWGLHEAYYPTIAYGKLISLSYDGNVYAFDVKTGKQVWKFSSGNSGLETSTGTYPFFYGPIIANGVIFVGNGYETPFQPLPRGARVFALDASTGEEIWNMEGMIQLRAIAEGYLLGINTYDSQLYCVGKGPSKTTVTAPQVGVTTSTPITIAGTVTDISAGSQQNAVAANFPNGLPCVSDESEGAWMSYVYQQQPKPANATGVTVFLQALKSDGTIIDIWHAQSDSLGHYEYTWTPPDTGTYKIIATFEGSGAYWPSSDECAISVGPTPSAINVPSASDVANQVVSQLPTEAPYPTAPSASEIANQVVSKIPSPVDNTMILIAAVAIAIIIGIVNLALLIRKKPT